MNAGGGRCSHCGHDRPTGDGACPRCGARPGDLGLAGPQGALERTLQDEMEKVLGETRLARSEGTAALERSLREQAIAPLDVADLDGSVERVEEALAPSIEALEAWAGAAEGPGLTLEGIRVDELLDRGVDTRTILQPGIKFMRHRRYDEAREWWSLNRAPLDPATDPVHLLLLIMEAVTLHFDGKTAGAAALRNQVRQHPLFPTFARGGRGG